MNEEKDLQEEEIAADEGMEDLSSFVDFADLDELEFTGNEDVFGELGDIADLGEMPDLSLDDLMDESALEETEEIPMPDLMEEEAEGTVFHTVEPEPEVDISLSDSLEESVSMPEEDDGLDAESEIAVLESDDESDTEDDIPVSEEEGNDIVMLLGSDDVSDMENDIETAEPDNEMADSFSDEAVGISMMDGGADAPILDDAVSEILAGEDGVDDPGLGFVEEEETTLAAEESNSESGLDSMLGGLLDNLDMDGSLSGDNPIGMEDSLEPMGDFDGVSVDTEDMLDISGMVPEAEKKEEKAPGFFKRVFGNVVTDEIAEQERLAAQKEEEAAAKKEEEEAKAKEEAEAKKAEKDAEKAAKKEEKKKLKEAKKAEKAAAKEEKKKKKEEEKAAEAAELEVIGKLNKVGVSIIVIATVLFLTAEIVGTNIFGYINKKNKALDYFEMGKYTQAYQEAVGTNMSKKDKEDYDKIKVVMKVQQSLNAYQHYDRINYYPEALDALLRGLKRYDANIDQGIELEVDGDMMSCRKEILTLLQSQFDLSESDAYSILALDSEAYQKKVVELGLKKI